MAEGERDASATSRLIASACAHQPPAHFAILDGALYDNMPALLAGYRLRGRPLFLEAGDADAVASGPFLIPLDSADQISAVISLVGQGRTPVVWSWPDGEQALYRHLRTLNMASTPAEHDIDDDAASEAEWTGSEGVPGMVVVFRHWDPHVLTRLSPLLRSEQVARLIGKATGICFVSNDGSVQAILPPPDGTVPKSGILTFDQPQVAALAQSRLHESRLNIFSYLRETAAEELRDTDDAALYAIIVEAEVSGSRIGLVSEYAQGLWAYLHVLTAGETSRSQEVRQHFYKAAEDPEVTLRIVLDEVLAELERG